MPVRRPLPLLLTAGAIGFLPLSVTAPADAATLSCSAGGGTLTVNAANYAYDQRFSVEGPSHHLWIHDGAAAINGDECAVDVRTVDTITVNSDSFADDWVVDLSSDWTGANGTDVLVNLPAGQYDTVKLDGSTANSAVTVDWVGSGTTYQFDTDGDLTPDISFDGQWGSAGYGLKAVKGGSSTDTIDLTGVPTQSTTLTVQGGDGADVVTGSDGFDNLTGGGGNDIISGGANFDILDGNGGDDFVYGGPGSDIVNDSDGADTLDGDAANGEDGYADILNVFYDGYTDLIGDATISYDKVVFYSDGMPVEASQDGTQNDGVFSEDNLLGVRGIQTFGGEDQVKTAGFDSVDTGGGDDRLILAADHQGQIHWSAGPGSDTLDASGLQGSLHGAFYSDGSQLMTEGAGPGNIDGSGWEVVYGGAGNDDFGAGCACTVIPGPGDDHVDLGAGGTYRAGAAGDGADSVTVAEGASGVTADYTTRTAAVSLTIDGEANDGSVGEGDNLGFGITVLTGGQGNDTLAGSTAADTLNGFIGADTLLGRGGNDTLAGDEGTDTLRGGSGDDTLLGEAGGDKLYGGDGDDVLRGDFHFGPFGNDTLDGGNGDDDLFGYGGADTFVEGAAANGSDLISGGDGKDTASYALRSAALKLSLNGLYDDGAAGEGDRLGGDIENLVGGKGADTLTGNLLVNLLTGGAGNDTFQSLDGVVDTLNGGTGTDRAHRDNGDLVTSVEQRF